MGARLNLGSLDFSLGSLDLWGFVGFMGVRWIEWATAKANWLDPTIRAEDPYFGVREHKQSEEYKKLKKKGYWY